jgi:hypothetical protein
VIFRLYYIRIGHKKTNHTAGCANRGPVLRDAREPIAQTEIIVGRRSVRRIIDHRFAKWRLVASQQTFASRLRKTARGRERKYEVGSNTTNRG